MRERHRQTHYEAPRPLEPANPERPGNKDSTTRPPAAVLIDLARRAPLFIPAERGATLSGSRFLFVAWPPGRAPKAQPHGRGTQSGLASAPMTRSGEFRTETFAGAALSCQRGERLVFAGLSFSLVPSGLLLLRGPNGSGKSSLLRLMAGLLAPAEGSLTWGGAAIGRDGDAHRRRLAFLGHLDALKPALSASENLAFWCGREAVQPALSAWGLDHLAKRPARLLSQGQRRRLALARILASKAALWLLDEPTNALDDEAVMIFAQRLAAHRAAGGMAVIALHGENDLPDAILLDLADFAPGPPATFLA
jgi:heme exporter protein A